MTNQLDNAPIRGSQLGSDSRRNRIHELSAALCSYT
jgi:hypothetical protein